MYLNIVMCAVSIQYICLSNSRLPLLRLCNSKKLKIAIAPTVDKILFTGG